MPTNTEYGNFSCAPRVKELVDSISRDERDSP